MPRASDVIALRALIFFSTALWLRPNAPGPVSVAEAFSVAHAISWGSQRNPWQRSFPD
jgi:hypothetical protein